MSTRSCRTARSRGCTGRVSDEATRRVWNNPKAPVAPDTGVTITLSNVGDMGYNLGGSHSPGTVKNETTKIFPEFGNEFNHLFRRDLADHFLRVPFGHFDDNLVDTLIVAK